MDIPWSTIAWVGVVALVAEGGFRAWSKERRKNRCKKVQGFPTMEGFYWYIRPAPSEPQIVMIKHGKVWAHGALDGGPIEALDTGCWFGPLEPPR